MPFESFSSDSIRPEYSLLLWCVRKCPDTEKTEQIRTLIRKGIDWSYLTEAAAGHGLLPVLYKYFESHHIEEVPEDALNGLRDHFRKNALWNLGRTRELLKLLDLFDAERIQAIPYKGPILAQQVYGDLFLRQFDDLDIFVHKEDVLRAKKILLAEGYRPEFDLTNAQEKAYLKSDCEYNFNSDSNGIHVEVHWGFVPRYLSVNFNTENLWKNLQTLSLFEKKVLTSSMEDLFLILCVHCGYKHFWERLSWLVDLANLVECLQESSWEKIFNECNRMRIEQILFLSLFLARDLIGIKLPKSVSQKIDASPIIEELAQRVYNRLFVECYNSDGFWGNSSSA